MSQPEQDAAAIARCYDAATSQGSWASAFDQLLAATGFDGAAFYVVDRATRQPLDARWHRLDPAYADAYLRDYVPIDPRAAQVFVPKPRRVLYDYLHTEEAAIDRDPFYAWFQKSQRMRYYVGGQSRAGASLPVTLTLHRPKRQGHATPAELQRFSRLFNHFEHAVGLQHRLQLAAGRDAAAHAERHDTHGVILLDRDLAILHVNAAAMRIAARDDGLRLSTAGLVACRAADDAALQRLLAASRRHQVARPMEIARRYGGLPYLLTAYPVPGPDLLVGAFSVAVAVRILDPDADDTGGLARAASLLGLTRQEARVVTRLAEGADPIEIAAEMGVQPATIRTYLAAIYRKTGCHRQAALIARVTRLAGFFASSGEPSKKALLFEKRSKTFANWHASRPS